MHRVSLTSLAFGGKGALYHVHRTIQGAPGSFARSVDIEISDSVKAILQLEWNGMEWNGMEWRSENDTFSGRFLIVLYIRVVVLF